MADTDKQLRCTIVTPEAPIEEAEVQDVVLPAHDGLLGVWPGHAPLLCRLGEGLLRYRDLQSKLHVIYIDGGFGQVLNDEVTILADRAVTAGKIDAATAQQQLHEAEEMSMATIEEVAQRSAAVTRAKYLIALTESQN